MKSILILSTSPIKFDGLSRLIFEIISYNSARFEFELAAPDTTFVEGNKENTHTKSYILPDKSQLKNYLSEIRKLVKENNYDIIYIHGNSAMMFFEAFVCKVFSKSKIITHCHSSSSEHKLAHHLIKPFFNLLPDIKIGCSKTASDWAYIGSNVITIPNGIDVDRFRFDPVNRDKIRNKLGIKEKDVLIGNVGRLSKGKNQLFFVDIVREYCKINNDCKAVIIGEGEMKQEIAGKIRKLGLDDRFIFVSPVNDIEKYYSAIDVMAMPSMFEGLSLVSLETQANNLPCVASREFIKDSLITDCVTVESLDSGPDVWAADVERCNSEIVREKPIDDPDFIKRADIKVMMDKITRVLETV